MVLHTFKYNDILFSELPYASIVKDYKKKSLCSYCFKGDAKILACQQCKYNRYCNKACQKKDWKIHKVECKAIAACTKIPNDMCLLLLRMMIKYKNNENNKSTDILSNEYGFKPSSFCDLDSDNDNDFFISNNFNNLMKDITSFLKPIERKLTDFVSEKDARKIYQNALTNLLVIQNEDFGAIGDGCYLNVSRLRYSCWPNSIYNFEGNKLVLRAIKDIEPNNPVYICYTDPLRLRADRRSTLFQNYHFVCQCEACCDDELEREMSQLFCSQESCTGSVRLMYNSENYQCNKCGKVELKTQMESRHEKNLLKLAMINELIKKNKHKEALAWTLRTLNDYNLENQPENAGGLYQLLFGEKAFELALFLKKDHLAKKICFVKSRTRSWIHERFVRFLGTENHPIAKKHLVKSKNC